MIDLIVIGAGGHAKACIDVIESTGLYNIVGLIDSCSMLNKKILGYEVIGTDDDIPKLSKKCKNFLIGIGHIKSPDIRIGISNKLLKLGVNLPTVISRYATVSKYAKIGRGSIIMHNSVINSCAKVGDFSIVNTNAVIEHDCNLGDFTHMSVSSTVCGSVSIGHRCFLGGNSIIKNNVTIGSDVIIGAASYVNKDIYSSGVYIGTPVKKMEVK